MWNLECGIPDPIVTSLAGSGEPLGHRTLHVSTPLVDSPSDSEDYPQMAQITQMFGKRY